MRKQKGSVALSIIIISLIALVGLGAYFFGNSISKTLWPDKKSSSAPQESNWKTYENTDYKLKYPATWELVEAPDGCGPVFKYPNTNKVWLVVCGPYEGEGQALRLAEESAGIGSLAFRTNTEIAGHKAIQQEVRFEPDLASIENYIEVTTNGTPGAISANLYIKDPSLKEEAKNSLAPILSSFEFSK